LLSPVEVGLMKITTSIYSDCDEDWTGEAYAEKVERLTNRKITVAMI